MASLKLNKSFSKPLFYYKYMIKKNIFNDLRECRLRGNRKPLILRWARQVGKTILVRTFFFHLLKETLTLQKIACDEILKHP